MYVSPAVRSIRDDPVDGDEVRLLVRYDAPVDDDVEAAVRDAGGEIEGELQFGGREVRVDHEAVGDLLALFAERDLPVDAVETAAVVDPGDAGEDVGDPGDG
jgi:hypothetical protein